MSFEKCCNFYPNKFKFCAVKKNYFIYSSSVSVNAGWYAHTDISVQPLIGFKIKNKDIQITIMPKVLNCTKFLVKTEESG